jgi:hypothetical protein
VSLLLLLVRDVPGMSAVAGVPFDANTRALASTLLLLLVPDVTGMSAVAGVPSVAFTRAVAGALLLLLIRAVPGMSGVAGTLSVTNLPSQRQTDKATFIYYRQRCPTLSIDEFLVEYVE